MNFAVSKGMEMLRKAVGEFAITEPDAGSNVMAMSSIAQNEGDH